ncbi:PiggyBac transposable element-derived protein 3 [Eumeta japonica]|uniref:PiggyBac transposable element-derived protein 3 n=1 Tax=Eumeta variegata TaxID=151549 RepID=A0A4C1U039_EUMVA|nr:PiggyBac transposable element-derived protein 3 [Eumeta japonica]
MTARGRSWRLARKTRRDITHHDALATLRALAGDTQHDARPSAVTSLSVNEIISHLEDETDVLSADIYITPPENYDKSDGDSGDEESTHINNLSRHQLFAEAELRATIASETGIDMEDSVLDAPTIEPMPSTSSAKPPPRKKKCILVSRRWRDIDIPNKPEKETVTPSFLEDIETPIQFFELFFDEEVFELLHSQTEKNAIQKGKHGFRVTVTEMKHFTGILLLSGYNSVARFGYKNWSICTRLGYLIYGELYQGVSTGNTRPELGIGASVVLDLVEKLPTGSYSLYMDNFFTSLPLLNELKKLGHEATGTIRANRVENAPLKHTKGMKKTKRGSYDQRTDVLSDITLVRYNDNNIVTVASTQCGVAPVGKVKRFCDKEKKDVDQPRCIVNYNKYMGGVDRLDQNVGCYRISIRLKRYIVTTYFLMKEATKTSSGGKLSVPKSSLAVMKRVPDSIRLDGQAHHIIRQEKSTRCGLCHKNTFMKCAKCNVALHQKCTINFHSK